MFSPVCSYGRLGVSRALVYKQYESPGMIVPIPILIADRSPSLLMNSPVANSAMHDAEKQDVHWFLLLIGPTGGLRLQDCGIQ